jgi:hypothetical protein
MPSVLRQTLVVCGSPQNPRGGHLLLANRHSLTLGRRRQPRRRTRSLSSTLLHRTLDLTILVINTHSPLQNTAFLDGTARHIRRMALCGLETESWVAVGVARGLGGR